MTLRRKPSAQTYDPHTAEEHTVETPLNGEMSKSFLEYTYSVICACTLPNARNGSRPVKRRIVYQMDETDLTPDRPCMKSVRVVGEVMGKFHPYDDSTICEAMMHLAQPFIMRLSLVDGHGNLGPLDNDPVTSRYTGARLDPATLGMSADTDEDIVGLTLNYDDKLKEPTVLSTTIPDLPVSGGSGIAVGMATDLTTHGLGEVVDTTKFLMAYSDAILEQLVHYVPGPGWPADGTVTNRGGTREAYVTGRGTLTTRAVTHTEYVTARKQAIMVTELPYMTGPEKIVERTPDGVKNHKPEGISGVLGPTDRHNGTRAVVETKTGFDLHAALMQLFKHTPLRGNFVMNNVALVEGRLHTIDLKEMFQVWVDHRHVVIRRRNKYRKKKALERLYLAEGLLLTTLDIDEVVQVIRTSGDADTAKSRLMVVFDLDEVQAQHILDLRLRQLTEMNRTGLEAGRDDPEERTEGLTQVLASVKVLDRMVTDEMDEVAAEWGSPCRTMLLNVDPDGTLTPVVAQGAGASGAPKSMPGAVKAATTIPSAKADITTTAATAKKTDEQSTLTGVLKTGDEPYMVTMSTIGLITCTTPGVVNVFNARPTSDGRLRDGQITIAFETSVCATYGLITSAGHLVLAHVVGLSASSATTTLSLKGGAQAGGLIGMTGSTDPTRGEHVITAIAMEQPTSGKTSAGNESEDGRAAEAKPLPSLATGTRNGATKRWNREASTTMDSWSTIDLRDDDKAVFAVMAKDDDHLVFISSDSSLLIFEAKNVRPQGRTTGDMAGIKPTRGARVTAFNVVPAGEVVQTYEEDEGGLTSESGAMVLTVTDDSGALPDVENDAAKVTPLEMYPAKGRATGGVRPQRFLKGRNTLTLVWMGLYPLHASTSAGSPVELPRLDMRRDGSGADLAFPIAFTT